MSHLTSDDIDQYLDGALPAERETHLAGCRDCALAAREARLLALALASLPRYGPQPRFADRVMARVRLSAGVRAAPARQRRWMPAPRRAWAWATGLSGLSVASVATAVGLGLAGHPWVAVPMQWMATQAGSVAGALLVWGQAQLAVVPWDRIGAALAADVLRTAGLGTLGVAAYAAGLLSLRSLMRPPRRAYAASL